jgi:hypothetical protein
MVLAARGGCPYAQVARGWFIAQFPLFMLSRSVVVLAALTASALPADLGPGTVFTSGIDLGERLNVDDTFTLSLAAGTYAVNDFSYFSTAASGSVVPFISVLNGVDSYELLWIGSGLAGTLDTAMSTNPAGFFTLAAPKTVYGGFYTTLGGRVAFGSGPGQTVDHAGAVVVPRGGVSTAGFSNANLARTYAFKIAVDASPLLVVGPGFLSNTQTDSGDRLNIDAAHPLTLGAGQYNVDDFSFLGANAGGTVTPFLARLTASDTYETVWVGDGVGGVAGDLAVNPAGGFTLAGSETLFAGFYTAGGANINFTEGVGRPPGFGVTEHDSSFSGPTGSGQVVSGFSNPDLARTYSFSVGVAAVPEPGCAALLAGAAALLAGRRRRV